LVAIVHNKWLLALTEFRIRPTWPVRLNDRFRDAAFVTLVIFLIQDGLITPQAELATFNEPLFSQ